MLINDRYFTPEIADEDRSEFQSILGLNKLSYVLVEWVDETLIRVDEYKNNQVETLLHVSSRESLEKYISDNPVPVIEIRRSESSVVPLQPQKKGIWETVLTYPLCKTSSDALIRPADFEAALKRLQEAFSLIEKKVAPFEVGLITFLGPLSDFHLLMHFVRGSRIRVGVPHDFDAFLSTFRGAVPTIGELEGYFGTTVAYGRVEIPQFEDGASNLEALAKALQDANASVVCSSRGFQEDTAASTIQL